MKKFHLEQLQLMEAWHENGRNERWKANLPFNPHFPLNIGMETDSLSLVYFEIEPGEALAEHTDSAEEAVVLLSGTVEATVGSEKGELTQGEVAIIPAMAPHSIRNIGEEKARCLGFFSSKQVTSSFNETVMPLGIKSLG